MRMFLLMSTGKAGLDMEMRICASGLKVITKEQGLTEYRAHRITYSICPPQHPRMFVWVYRHDGKKLKVCSH
jgi:Phosphotyrosine interaction domain (PTB/PID)